jgi:hypothetical protein
MYNLSEEGKDLINPFINCKIIYRKRQQPDFWLFVDGWHIDLTAKQFDPDESCPKVGNMVKLIWEISIRLKKEEIWFFFI